MDYRRGREWSTERERFIERKRERKRLKYRGREWNAERERTRLKYRGREREIEEVSEIQRKEERYSEEEIERGRE